MSVMTERGVIVGMSEVEYHAHSALSSTGARALLKSPARFRWEREHPVVKDAFDVGSAVHMQVLGTGWPVDVHDFDNWRTKAAQDARDESRANGRIPLLAKDYAPIDAMATAILNDNRARDILERNGHREVSLFANDPETGVEMRGRLDVLTADDKPTIIGDVKTAVSAADDDFARDAAKFGFHVQESWYRRLLALITGDTGAEFRFIVVEKSPPYLVNVIEFDAEFAQIGRSMAARALRVYAECVERYGDSPWPGYEHTPGFANLVGPPAWLAYAEGTEF